MEKPSKADRRRARKKKPIKRNIPVPDIRVTGLIPAPDPPDNENPVKFSFTHLHIQRGGKFCTSRCKNGWIECFLERVKSVSQMKMSAFAIDTVDKSLRNHKIRWEKTTEPKGFHRLQEQLKPDRPWQMSLSRRKHGRIHGFLLADIFYVVWVDPDHKLWK